MDFEIQPSDEIGGEQLTISLPTEVRLQLGVLLGQMLQFDTRGKEIFLKVVEPLRKEQKEALVSERVFALVGGKDTSYKVPPITLGCDPEFFIVYRGRRVSAATYLPFEGQIGCDGGLGELRPMYGRHASQVVENLSHLIAEIPSKIKRADWAGSAPSNPQLMDYVAYSYLQGVAAGFHVHLGIPHEILNTRADISRPVLNYLVKAMDWYVSIPTVLLEINNERRCGASEYGQPGDYRTTNVTLEYRTPGGFFLRSPVLAGGLMGTTLLLTEYLVGEIRARSGNFVKLRDMSKQDLFDILPVPRSALRRLALTQESKALATRAYPVVKEKLRKLPNYESHRQVVEDFFSVVDSRGIPAPDLIPNWKERK